MAKKTYLLDTSVCLTDADAIFAYGYNDILIPLNIKREKMVHIMDSLNATYLHTTWEKVTELLSSCGFHNFKRLTGATSTDFDEDVVSKDPYGKEKFGGGDLRIACQKL